MNENLFKKDDKFFDCFILFSEKRFKFDAFQHAMNSLLN